MKNNGKRYDNFFVLVSEFIDKKQINAEKSNWRLFTEWLEANHFNVSPEWVNDSIIKEYVLFLNNESVRKVDGKKISRSTIGRRLTTVRNIYQYAEDKKIIDTNPAKNVTLKSVIQERKYSTNKQIFEVKFDDIEYRLSATNSDEAYRLLRERLRNTYFPERITITKLSMVPL